MIPFSPKYESRTAELKAAEQKAHDDFAAEIRRARDIETKAQYARDAALSAAKTAAEAKRIELEKALARDVQNTIGKLAAAYGEAPRSTATALAATWLELDARCRDELGARLDWRHLALAFAAANGCAEQLAADRDAWRFVGDTRCATACDRAASDFAEGPIAPARAQALLDGVELAVTERAARSRHADPEMLDALLSRATRGAQDEAAQALDKARNGAPRAPADDAHAAEQARRRIEADVGMDEVLAMVKAHRHDEGSLER